MDVQDAPPSKVPRLERAIKITDVKLHSRLNIYDFVGYDVNLPKYGLGYDLSIEPENADDTFKKYARIGQAAAAFGDLETIQYLSKIEDNPLSLNRVSDEERKSKLEDISIILLLTRNWKGLKWTVEKGYFLTESLATNGIEVAIKEGASMEMLKWLHSQGWLLDEYTFPVAATRGDIEIMKWLHEEQCPWDFNTFCKAVRHGNMEILKWLKKEGCPWNERVFWSAAETGNLQILVWLRVEGCPWCPNTFYWAIDGGADLLTLKWLYHEKCPWNEYAMTAAVKRGDMEILMWLREKQCPWNASCIHAALKKKNVDVLKWLHQEKCPWNEETYNMLMTDCMSHYTNHQPN
jgi:hypothetical protein